MNRAEFEKKCAAEGYGEIVDRDDIVKAYEYVKGEYIELEQEEIDDQDKGPGFSRAGNEVENANLYET